MLISQEPVSVMPLLRIPLTQSDSRMNLSCYRRPIFYFSLEGFLEGQIGSMNGQRIRGMMIGSLQLVSAKPITTRLGKVQIVLIKMKVGLFVRGKSASDAIKSIEFSLIQFEAFAPDGPHIIRPASLSYLITNRHNCRHKFQLLLAPWRDRDHAQVDHRDWSDRRR